MFLSLLRRELMLLWRRPADMINPLFFFVLVISMFPLGVSPSPELLSEVASGVVWVAALLAVLLSVDAMFRADHDSGALEQLLAAPVPLYLPVLAKLVAHWLMTGLPLVVVAPVTGYMLHLPEQALKVLLVSLLMGTPVMTAVGAIGASLTVSLRSGGILLALLVLPLYVPVLIFGAGVVVYAADGLPVDGVLALLGAMLVAAITLAPMAVAAGLRISGGD